MVYGGVINSPHRVSPPSPEECMVVYHVVINSPLRASPPSPPDERHAENANKTRRPPSPHPQILNSR